MKKLYRVLSKKELVLLLSKGTLENGRRNYISLSEDVSNTDYYLEHNDNLEIYDVYLITFNQELLIEQGAIKVEYTLDFMINNPKVYAHFNGGTIQSDSDETIKQIIECYSYEKEWVIEKFKIVPGLLLDIQKLTGNKKVDKDVYSLVVNLSKII